MGHNRLRRACCSYLASVSTGHKTYHAAQNKQQYPLKIGYSPRTLCSNINLWLPGMELGIPYKSKIKSPNKAQFLGNRNDRLIPGRFFQRVCCQQGVISRSETVTKPTSSSSLIGPRRSINGDPVDGLSVLILLYPAFLGKVFDLKFLPSKFSTSSLE